LKEKTEKQNSTKKQPHCLKTRPSDLKLAPNKKHLTLVLVDSAMRLPSKTSVIILRTGDALPSVASRHGQFASWIERGLRPTWTQAITERDVRHETITEDEIVNAAGIVVTGSAASVTERAPWMLRTESLLAAAVERYVPVLGICFGHQLLAQALGGHVAKNPRGWELGTISVRLERHDHLFDELPPTFEANATHVDTVAKLPAGASVFAQSDGDQVASFGFRNARGVQFHPEINRDIMHSYLEKRRHLLAIDGIDVESLCQRVKETPSGRKILRNFVRHFVMRNR